MTTLHYGAMRRAICKEHVLDHVAACSPCTYASALQWARAQGVDCGFTQNVNELKAEGKVFVSEDDEQNLILEIAA